jgi:hypothetical protein
LKIKTVHGTLPGCGVQVDTASSGRSTHAQARPGSAENTVNDALTLKRRRPITDNSEYSAFVRCILSAYSRRIATADVESLAHRIHLADDINDPLRQAINGLRVAGYSWAEIGARPGSYVKPHNNAAHITFSVPATEGPG